MSVVALDSTFLLLVLHESVPVPKDPSTGKPWEKGRERVEHLIDQLSEDKSTIVIPTPALAEVFVRAGATAINDYIAKVRAHRQFRVASLDQKAAIEVALMTDAALKAGRKRGDADAPWQKVKIDRQIVAIAKVESAELLYTSDRSLSAIATREGLKVRGFGDLSLPPVADQHDWVEGTTEP